MTLINWLAGDALSEKYESASSLSNTILYTHSKIEKQCERSWQPMNSSDNAAITLNIMWLCFVSVVFSLWLSPFEKTAIVCCVAEAALLSSVTTSHRGWDLAVQKVHFLPLGPGSDTQFLQ